MWLSIISFIGKLLPFIKEAAIAIAGVITGKTIEQNKQLQAENDIQEKAIQAISEINTLSDNAVVDELLAIKRGRGRPKKQ